VLDNVEAIAAAFEETGDPPTPWRPAGTWVSGKNRELKFM